MRHERPLTCGLLTLAAALLFGCNGRHSNAESGPPTTNDDKVVNLYIWSDYLAPDTLSDFERQTGIKAHVSYFDNNETMEARISTGHSGFDVAVPTGAVLKRQIRSGMFAPLDKAKLPNLNNLDSRLMSRVTPQDPGNRYAIIYTWGTVGVGYNEQKIADRLPGIPLNSWKLVFDPALAAKVASCGINVIDDPLTIVQTALKYLGRDRAAPTAADFNAVERLFTAVRPFIRNIDTSGDIEAMANGDICVALTYNGDFVQARKRAIEAKNGQRLRYFIPEEGAMQWFDQLAIPTDAPHIANAHALINYLLTPSVMAHVTNAIGFANANAVSTKLLDPTIASDSAIYPTQEQQERLFLPIEYSLEQQRTVTRLWQKFKTGQ